MPSPACPPRALVQPHALQPPADGLQSTPAPKRSLSAQSLLQPPLGAAARTQPLGYPTLDDLGVQQPFSMITLALSLLLVFKTNSSYGRFWEARTLWGQLINISRDLARLVGGCRLGWLLPVLLGAAREACG